MALKIVKYVDKKKGYRWSIRSRNGKIIADGAESYTSGAMRDKGLKALLEAVHAGEFKIVDETPAPKVAPVKKSATAKGVKRAVKPTLLSGSVI